MNTKERKLILDALYAYKDDDNEEYNVEINQLINKLNKDVSLPIITPVKDAEVMYKEVRQGQL